MYVQKNSIARSIDRECKVREKKMYVVDERSQKRIIIEKPRSPRGIKTVTSIAGRKTGKKGKTRIAQRILMLLWALRFFCSFINPTLAGLIERRDASYCAMYLRCHALRLAWGSWLDSSMVGPLHSAVLHCPSLIAATFPL